MDTDMAGDDQDDDMEAIMDVDDEDDFLTSSRRRQIEGQEAGRQPQPQEEGQGV